SCGTARPRLAWWISGSKRRLPGVSRSQSLQGSPSASARQGACVECSRRGRRRYLSQVACARTALERKRPKLILMAGISGTGKTWLAERIAPSLRAVHLRSDIERKRLAGIGETDRSHSTLGGGIYEPKMNEAVYEHLA